MQHPIPSARWIDRICGCTLLFALCFLWFQSRKLTITLSATLAAALAILLLYGVFLIKRKFNHHYTSDIQQTLARYALSMLPNEEALQYAADALSKQYALILPTRPEKDRLLITYDKSGRNIAIDLCCDPSGADKRSVHEFHRRRGALPGVLICLEKPDKTAANYAETLSPPLCLLEASELILDPSLASRFLPPKAAKKKRTADALLAAGYAQAVHCMFFSFFMIVCYLLTDRVSILLPALALAFFALMCKTKKQQKTLF